jgi:hypothetical protein
MENVLKVELETFQKLKKDLIRDHNGKYALIKGDELIGVFESQKDAINTGISKFGSSPFLVKKIEEIEEGQNFTSNLIWIDKKCLP